MKETYKLYFVGGPMDGFTQVSYQSPDVIACVNEPLQYYNPSDGPIVPLGLAPKIGRYVSIDVLKVHEEFPPFHRRIIMEWKG